MSDRIYLDYNATAPVRPNVYDVWREVTQLPCNPSSIHKEGRAAKALLEMSRRALAEMLSCWPAELVFTSGGSEANMMALTAFPDMPKAVAVTEHASVLEALPDAVRMPVNRDGVLDMDALERILKQTDKPTLVSVMLANNETGVIQPIQDIAAMVHRYGGIMHCDAVQAFTKIPVDCTLLGIDILTLSAHKIGAGTGAGLLYIRQPLMVPSLIKGGKQEEGRRAGTENLAAIVAFSNVAELAMKESEHMQKLRQWLDQLENKCQLSFPHHAIVMGKHTSRLPNTVSLQMPNVESQKQLMYFDLNHIAVSAGSACSSGRITASHVIAGMLGEGAGDDVIRISGGWATKQSDIEHFGAVWQRYVKKIT